MLRKSRQGGHFREIAGLYNQLIVCGGSVGSLGMRESVDACVRAEMAAARKELRLYSSLILADEGDSSAIFGQSFLEILQTSRGHSYARQLS